MGCRGKPIYKVLPTRSQSPPDSRFQKRETFVGLFKSRLGGVVLTVDRREGVGLGRRGGIARRGGEDLDECLRFMRVKPSSFS